MGLYDRSRATIPGFSAKYVKSQEQHVANDFVQRLRLQQLRLKVDLRQQSSHQEFTDEKLIKANVQRLEALDRLSLYFCMGGAEDLPSKAVPVNDEGAEVDWEIRPARPESVLHSILIHSAAIRWSSRSWHDVFPSAAIR